MFGMYLDFIKFTVMLITIQKYTKERRVGITSLVLELLDQLRAYTHEQRITQYSDGGRGMYVVQ
jgi:hypothetical protein